MYEFTTLLTQGLKILPSVNIISIKERPVVSGGVVLLNQNYVTDRAREVAFAFLPLRSVLKVLQILSFPSDPELIGQVLCPPPPVTGIQVLWHEVTRVGC